ncbi:S-layer homology domain-containing protein [Brevibacillus sp. B_LB10_24]|uniref:S-layer homology domain-containing protein n=1 Tax=Brevibacillus sp. B_LB10_24 TaxID=3380645 RepID=UPI0038BC6159
MKKVVNSLLASALALTVAPMVVGAEGGATSDAANDTNPELTKTVKRLQALEIVKGDDKGQINEGNPITRAEFATLVVRVRGLADGVPLAKFQPNFKDIKVSDWYAGWINVASGRELIKGYPDKTFKPENNVTYAEAVTMIVRALGYEPAVLQEGGVWPNNFISKSAELGVSKGVSIDPNKPATRGDVFLLLDNALDINLMKQTTYGSEIRYQPVKGTNLLNEYMNIDVYNMEWASSDNRKSEDLPTVSNVPVTDLGNLKPNEISFSGRSGTPLRGKYTVVNQINPNDFAGQRVQVWMKNERGKNTIVWMEDSTDQDVITTTIEQLYQKGKIPATDKDIDWSGSTDSVLRSFDIELGNGKKYRLASDAKVAYNFKVYGNAIDALKDMKLSDDDIDSYSAKVVLNDDGEISYLSVVDDLSAKQNTKFKFGSEVIKTVDASKQKIEPLKGNTLDLKKDEEGRDFMVIRNGEPAKLSDLKPMDVYSVYYSDHNKDRRIIIANSTVVEGKVSSVDYRDSDKKNDYFIKIGDKRYRLRNATYSENNNKTIEDTPINKIKALSGIDVKLYLDPSGRVRHIETSSSVKERRQGAILTKDVYYDAGKDQYDFIVMNEKGTKVTLPVKDKKNILDKNGDEMSHQAILDTFKVAKDKNGDGKISSDEKNPLFFTYELNSKGDVREVRVADGDLIHIKKDEWRKAADKDDNLIRINGHDYEVPDDNVVFDMKGAVEKTGDRFELKNTGTGKYSKIAKDDFEVYVHINNNNEADYFLVVDGDKSIASDGLYGFVVNFSRLDGDDAVEILDKEGKLKTYVLDGSVNFKRRDFIYYDLNGNDEIDTAKVIVDGGSTGYKPGSARIKDQDWARVGVEKIYVARVDEVDGRKITYYPEYNPYEKNSKSIEDSKKETYYTTANTVYYNMDTLEADTGVEEGDYVALIDSADVDGRYIDYVVIVAKGDKVDDFDYKGDYNMNKFLNWEDLDLGDVLKADPKGVVDGNKYTVTGQLSSDYKKATVEVKIGGKTYEADVNSDGSFEFSKTIDGDYDKYTLIVTKDGKEVLNKDYNIKKNDTGEYKMLDAKSVTPAKATVIAGAPTYRVKGNLQKGYEDATVTVEFGGKKYDAEVTDGAFKVTKTVEGNFDTFTVTVTKDGKTETYEGNFPAEK